MHKKQPEDSKNNSQAKSSKKLDLNLKTKLKIGKINIVNPKNLKNEFYCSICDVLRHDSLSYQSHMTSKVHMKNVGKDLITERSSLDQVRRRLQGLSYENNKKDPETVKKAQISKKQKKNDEEEPMSTEQAEIFSAMGFKSFGYKI